jgi:hypothetical protein
LSHLIVSETGGVEAAFREALADLRQRVGVLELVVSFNGGIPLEYRQET